MNRYFIIHKPYNVLSQFTSDDGKLCLKDFFKVPSNVYPIGRLDYDSEGLLLLTNDTSLNKQILHPHSQIKKTYWVQIEGVINDAAIKKLQQGVIINTNGKVYKTLPCVASILNKNEIYGIQERNPPIRERKNIPTCWVSITITEGKNRQVRKMTAAIGYPTLRLIRVAIGDISIGNLQAGQIIEFSKNSISKKLALAPQQGK